ncbi:pentatricopeptide repeat-containing protein At1g71420 [Macadamia integrifolia]|uniref:pentatricopeptide repeat-containing protein At1g71420 n=1 Tax=Macadamia integrifolia TaxID=60698 RepID=UPI001C52AA54|nr:pentatricopeptide repeat-containing protein At1g71420 [Macadamia integrifolia]
MGMERWTWRWRWRWERFYSGFCTIPNSSISQPDSVQLQYVFTLCARGQLQEALSLFYAINKPNSQAYATLLQGCARHRCLDQGRALHQHMLAHSHDPDLFVTNHLINLYAKCGCLEVARQLFDQMPLRNLVSWTALITGYDQHGRSDDCFRLFSSMLAHHHPTEFAFASVLGSCNCIRGRQVHALVLKTSFDTYVYVANALITMYSKNLGCDGAWAVFQSMPTRSLITWNSMLAGFQLCGYGAQSLDLFSQMHSDGIGFDRATFLSVISSLCSDDNDVVLGLEHCYHLHCLALKTGFVSQVEVATALMNAYSKLGGDVSECYWLFNETSGCRDVVSWTGIITSCAEQKPEQALLLFRQMKWEGLNPDCYTFSAVIKACAGLSTECHGSAVHAQVIKVGFEEDMVLANALIHAYARCGSICRSEQVFNRMEFLDIVSWNSIFKAYALHGKAVKALQLFEQMNVQPDAATFVSLLTACSHAGLVDQGTKIFDMMIQNYGIYPQRDHFACMVDILGRAGHLLEAEALIYKMPMEPDSVVWSALLGACRKHRESKMAELAGRKLMELDPKNSLGYVLMSNIYSSEGCFHTAAFIRKEMRGCRVRKEPGLSWIEVENQVHEFASGGQRHPQREAICAELEVLVGKLKGMGYVPETNSALHDIGEEHKEEQLFYHSEKLALAFVVMNSGRVCDWKTIRIMKNIRICLDCHNFMKLASDLLQREILVRDANRFHQFRGGLCSCSDYW